MLAEDPNVANNNGTSNGDAQNFEAVFANFIATFQNLPPEEVRCLICFLVSSFGFSFSLFYFIFLGGPLFRFVCLFFSSLFALFFCIFFFSSFSLFRSCFFFAHILVFVS